MASSIRSGFHKPRHPETRVVANDLARNFRLRQSQWCRSHGRRLSARGQRQSRGVAVARGGGWRRGSRQAVAPSAKALAGHGFVVLAVQYRLLGDAAWPAQIQDVNSAIRWARRNAGNLDVDADKIVVEGL